MLACVLFVVLVPACIIIVTVSLSLYVSILETSDFAIQIHAHACTDAVENTESHAVQNTESHAVRV